MGNKLTLPQREVYFQVKETLKRGGNKYSKGLLKKFVKWLLHYFPWVSPDQVKVLCFWDSVGSKLSSLRQRTPFKGKIFPFVSLNL